jgi:hypothetical protein
MIICIECNAKTKDELDDLLRIGGYRGYSEAVALAVSNQLLLHRGTRSDRAAASFNITGIHDPLVGRVTAPPGGTSTGSNGGRNDADTVILPALFRLVGCEIRTGKMAEMPNDAFAKGQRITVDRWIFGQHNKLLPLKASVRALANMSIEQGGGVPLSQAATEISLACESLGSHLRAVDNELGLAREESLATAFPSAAADINKSRVRFSTQFVGAVNRHGQLRGFPIDLKLVNYRNPKEPKLLLTEAGWTLASLANPILDQARGAANVAEKLSAEERAFLIQHIRDNVPVEDFAFRAVLTALGTGARSPDDLDAALRQYMPERSGAPFSPAFLSTQRAGVISRMTDLQLVLREREGVRVVYAISEQGKKYAECASVA